MNKGRKRAIPKDRFLINKSEESHKYTTKEEVEISNRIPRTSVRGYLRSHLYPSVKDGVDQIVLIQTKQNRFATHFWDFISIAGSHEFFVAFFPLIILGFGIRDVGGRLLAHAAMGIYIGNVLKDYFCLPRPNSPPVVQMNAHIGKEFGFPSTHAVTAVSLPLYLLIQLVPWNTTEFALYLLGSALWICLVSYSRLYLGMHCLVDIIGGISIGLIMLILGLGVEYFMDSLGWAGLTPINAFLLGIFLLLISPEPVEHCPCFVDSACFLGSSAGFFAGNFRADIVSYPLQNYSLSFCLTRWLIGFGMLVGVRSIAKPLIRKISYSSFKSLNIPTKKYLDFSKSGQLETDEKPIESAKWDIDIFLKYIVYFIMVEITIEYGLYVVSLLGMQ